MTARRGTPMTTPDAAAIIAAHYRKEAGRDHVDGVWVWLARCDCGWVGTADEYPHHVADMLAEAGFGPVGDAKADALALADEWEQPVEGRQEYATLAFQCAADELRSLFEDGAADFDKPCTDDSDFKAMGREVGRRLRAARLRANRDEGR